MLVEVPLGKALVPVVDYVLEICKGCYFQSSMRRNKYNKQLSICSKIICNEEQRKDGKNVIFKLVDYPVEVRE